MSQDNVVPQDDLLVCALNLHPIKSCAVVPVEEAVLVETGFEYDREWMVIDARGHGVTQRDHPRMALVRIALRSDDLVLRAPGMLALHVRLDAVEAARRAQVWNDEVAAFDMGDLAAQWFSDFLGAPLRLVRFDPEVAQRFADKAWTGAVQAPTAFVDQFPLLVISTASLAELNRRLVTAGQEAVSMNRFRPNIVLDGVADAHGEDFIDELTIESPDGPVLLKMVKPCTRCTVPDVDPTTGENGHRVADTLMGYRADPRFKGALTFGINAVIVAGIEHRLRVGARASATLNF